MQFSPDQLLKTTVHDKSGHKVGKVQQVYLDDATGAPSWVTVRTGFFEANESLVPVDEAELNGDQLQVPFDKQVIRDAPNYDPGHHLDESDEDELYRYYGISPSGSAMGQTRGRHQADVRPEHGEHAGERSEHRDQIGGERVEQPGTSSAHGQRTGEQQVRPEQASGEYISGSASAGDQEQRGERTSSDSTDRNQERDLLDRERELLQRERDLLDREREVAEQEGSVRPRLRRHDPGNRG